MRRAFLLVLVFFALTAAFAALDGDPSRVLDPLLAVLNPSASPAAPAASGRETAPSSPSGRLTLATWNIRRFSSRSRDDAELARICDVLERYDLIAVQELLDADALRRCAAELARRGKHYSFLVSDPVGRRVKERYGFLYRSDLLSASRPRLYPDTMDRFIREPYYADFRCGDFDFTLLTVHIIYKSRRAPERKMELDALASAFEYVQKRNGPENDVILTGDFNEEPGSPRFARLTGIDSLVMLVRGVKTTISDSSTYDQIVFQDRYTAREFTGRWGVFRFDEEMYGDEDRKASREVSDHRPVWAVFRTDAGDDDGS